MGPLFGRSRVRGLRLSFRAERRAGIDRGERDLHSEPDRGGIPRDFGTTNFKRKKGKRHEKETTCGAPRTLGVPDFLRFPSVFDGFGLATEERDEERTGREEAGGDGNGQTSI